MNRILQPYSFPPAVGGGSGIALVAHLEYSPNHGSATSGAIDTTGADLLVAVVGAYDGYAPTGFTDFYGNTWIALTSYSNLQSVRTYYSKPTSVGAGHTFTPTVPATYWTFLGVLAFSGSNAAPYDTENGAVLTGGGSPIQAGSVTPAQDGSLLVAGVFSYNAGAAPTIDSGMTAYGVACDFGYIGMGGIAWGVQATAAAINPEWTSAGNSGGNTARNITVFKPQ